jgi:hypothetical protein
MGTRTEMADIGADRALKNLSQNLRDIHGQALAVVCEASSWASIDDLDQFPRLLSTASKRYWRVV